MLMMQIMILLFSRSCCTTSPNLTPSTTSFFMILAPFVNKINISLRFPVVFIFPCILFPSRTRKKIFFLEIYLLYLLPDDSNQMKSFLLRLLSRTKRKREEEEEKNLRKSRIIIIIYANFCRWIRKFAVVLYVEAFVESRQRVCEKRCDIKRIFI